MTKTFTENDWLKYAYGEANDDEKRELDRAMAEDFSLKEKMDAMQRLIHQIDQLTIKAPEAAIDRILYASKNMCHGVQ